MRSQRSPRFLKITWVATHFSLNRTIFCGRRVDFFLVGLFGSWIDVLTDLLLMEQNYDYVFSHTVVVVSIYEYYELRFRQLREYLYYESGMFCQFNIHVYSHTLPETNSSPLKIGHPGPRNFIFQPLIFRG